ncbi:MAG: spore coat protein U domain-containing protein [Xanthomonadales bacterium]|nr:spore coat protein U domain-containing protein [Xanthomonadales bacterium]
MNLIRTSLAAAVAAVCCASLAQAGTAGDDFQVSAEVIAACSINASDLNFGDYNPVVGTAVDGSSTISVTCTNGAAYSIGLSAGASGNVAARAMDHDTENATLSYGLFSDALREEIWGDVSDTVDGVGTGANQNVTVYGRVFASQSTALVGSYADTITATVEF